MKTIILKNLENLLEKENLDKYVIKDKDLLFNLVNKIKSPLSIGSCLVQNDEDSEWIELFKIKSLKVYDREDELDIDISGSVIYGEYLRINKDFTGFYEGEELYYCLDEDHIFELCTLLDYFEVTDSNVFDETKEFIEKTLEETVKKLNNSVSCLSEKLRNK